MIPAAETDMMDRCKAGPAVGTEGKPEEEAGFRLALKLLALIASYVVRSLKSFDRGQVKRESAGAAWVIFSRRDRNRQRSGARRFLLIRRGSWDSLNLFGGTGV